MRRHVASRQHCSFVPRSPQITTVDEAKQFYPLFGLGANVALIFSGRAVKWFSQVCCPLRLPSAARRAWMWNSRRPNSITNVVLHVLAADAR